VRGLLLGVLCLGLAGCEPGDGGDVLCYLIVYGKPVTYEAHRRLSEGEVDKLLEAGWKVNISSPENCDPGSR
jgi:hypothetical protein